MDVISSDILGSIFQELDTQSLVRASLVCQEWNYTSERDKRLFLATRVIEDYGVIQESLNKNNTCFVCACVAHLKNVHIISFDE